MENKSPEIFTIIVNKKIIETWEEDVPDFTLLKYKEIWYDDELVSAKITPKIKDSDYTVEDVFDLTNALMVHEEYSSGFFTDEASLQKIGEIYCWDHAAYELMADLLTEGEKIHILIMQFDLITGEKPAIRELEYTLNTNKDPNKEYKPIIGNVQDLYEDKAVYYRFKPKDGAYAEISGYLRSILPDLGLFIIVLDEELEDEEQLMLDLEEDPEYEEAMDMYMREMEKDDYPWDYLDDDRAIFDEDYIDEWYRKKGLI